jgi:heme oxygenase
MDHETLISRIEIAAELGVQSQTIAHWERPAGTPAEDEALPQALYCDRAEEKSRTRRASDENPAHGGRFGDDVRCLPSPRRHDRCAILVFMVPASRALREETAEHHAALDERVRVLLTGGEEGCRTFLFASRRVVVPWETELRKFAWPDDLEIERRLRKSAWLEEDLGATPAGQPLLARAAGAAAAWGALYVFEGSTRGAAMIRRMPGCGRFRYLEGYGAETQVMWERMRAGLDHAIGAVSSLDSCLLAAKGVFAQFEEALL